MKTYCFFLWLLALGLTSCAASGVLTPGRYVETSGPGVVMFEDKELRLYADHKFEGRVLRVKIIKRRNEI